MEVNYNYPEAFMEIGKRLKQARLEAGLSQRQLCGGTITRNMLSLIENGTARPSMDTLTYLAGRLGKPVSFFLEEQAVTSPNTDRMARAREFFAAERYAEAVEALKAYQGPDATFDWEKGLLETLCHMALAEQAMAEGRLPYAETLLAQAAQAGAGTPYFGAGQERQRLLLQARLRPESAAGLSLDEELLLKAEAEQDLARVAALLDAMEAQGASRWCLLRGRAAAGMGEYARAEVWLKQAQKDHPREALPLLERCCRELGDFKGAYEYACLQRENK